MKCAPTRAAFAAYCDLTRSSVAMAAAQVTGLPPYVLPCAPRFHCSMMRRLAMTAPIGNPEPEALGARQDVGLHAPMFAREHLAGATDARLHFVEDQQDAVLVAELAQAGEKAVGRHEIAAFALDRLDQDRRDFGGRHVALEQHADVIEHRLALVAASQQRAVRVRVGHVRDAGHRRRKAFLLRVLARGERQRAHRAAMEAAEKADEARSSGHVARQLQRALRPIPCRTGR